MAGQLNDTEDQNMPEIVYKEKSYRTIGACFEVYKETGCGFFESTYQECLEIELDIQAIPFKPQLAP